MLIEQTVDIPASRLLHLDFELPFSVPAGVKAEVAVRISAPESAGAGETGAHVKSFRGVLKGRGITLARFREMRAEDAAGEDAADRR